MVLKPSEISSRAEAFIVHLCEEALDRDAFAVVVGGKEASTALLALHWDHITYTGGQTVGRIVAAAAARHLTPVLLELGGKNPLFVMADADLDETVKATAYGRWANCGQICLCPDYCLIDDAVYDSFVAKMLVTMREWYGENTQDSPALGRMISRNHFLRVRGYLEKTKGNILAGGSSDESDLFIAPTLVELTFEELVAGDDALLREEIFGPVMVVVKMLDVTEAVKFVNSQEKPLTLYIFSTNRQTVQSVVSGTNSGLVGVNVCVNNAGTSGSWLGGVGESGMGAYGFEKSFETFSHARQVVTWDWILMRIAGLMVHPPAAHNSDGEDSAVTEKALRLYHDIPGADDGGVGPMSRAKRLLLFPVVAAVAVGVAVVSQKLSKEACRNLLIVQAVLLASRPLSVLAKWQWRLLSRAGVETYRMLSPSQ